MNIIIQIYRTLKHIYEHNTDLENTQTYLFYILENFRTIKQIFMTINRFINTITKIFRKIKQIFKHNHKDFKKIK